MKKQFLSLLAVLLLGGQTVQALDNDITAATTLGGLATIAGAAYIVAHDYPALDDRLVGGVAAVAGLIWIVAIVSQAEYWTYRKIERHLNFLESKGPWARRKVIWHKHYLFNVEMTDANFDTVVHEVDCESVDFPLIEMFKKLQEADSALVHLRDLSDTVMYNTCRKQSPFYKKVVAQRARLDTLISRIRGNIRAIKQHRLWVEQWKMYQTKDIAFGKVRLQFAADSMRGA